jgi:hypothetical protein
MLPKILRPSLQVLQFSNNHVPKSEIHFSRTDLIDTQQYSIQYSKNGGKQSKFDVLLTVHHGTLMNQHQLDTLFLVCLLGVNASTCFGRYSSIFKRLFTDAIWYNYLRRMCVDYVQVLYENFFITEFRKVYNKFVGFVF